MTAPPLDAFILLAVQGPSFLIVEKSRLTLGTPPVYPAHRSTSASEASALHQAPSQADRVLAKFGEGLQDVAARLEWPYKRLWNWQAKGLIPQEWHQPLLDAAVRLGVDLHPYDFVAHLHRPVAAAPDPVTVTG